MTEALAEPPSPIARYAALAAAYALVALFAYGPALHGAFVSDDIGYVLSNPWIQSLSPASLRAILDPTGPVAAHTANYAPVHMLLHAATWALFGPATLGHHVANVLLHAAASALLVALFARSGIPFVAAALLGGAFLLHPANVEAVAWIFQLKTIAALALACGALLLEPRRPLVAALLFALALLTKIHAAFALPVVLVWASVGAPRGARPRAARLAWLGAWVLALVLAFLPELLAFERLGHAGVSPAPSAGERLRFGLALAGRYLAMAGAGHGLSAFHQPDPPASGLDAWLLVGSAGVIAMAIRAAVALVRREEEAAWWAWAAAGFLPVSQLLPFLYPMADRYLYYALPGLLGALGLAARRPIARVLASPQAALALAVAALVLVAAGVRAHERARIWRSDATLAVDAAAHYPNGIPAKRIEAAAAARRGDVDRVVAALRAATARGFDRFVDLERDPSFAAIRHDPRFAALVAEVAGVWIARVEARPQPTVQELVMLGQAYRARGEWGPAIARLESAVAAGGPGSEAARAELAATRIARLRAERERGRSAPNVPPQSAPQGGAGGRALGETTP